MEVTPNPSTTESTASTQAAQTTSAPQATTPNVEMAQADSSNAPASVEPKAFTPDFKFKVLDKEFEIEEMYRGLIKDEESQKNVKRIFEKAYGLERVEASRNELKTKLQTIEPQLAEFDGMKKQWDYLSSLVNEGDFGSFINEAQIDPKVVFKWVKDELKKLEMEPSQRSEMEQYEQYKRQARQLARENETLKAQYGQTAAQTQFQKVQQLAVSQEHAPIAQAYNEKMGDENAFLQAIVQEGAVAQMAGQMLTPEQAVAQVVSKLSKFGLGAQASAPQVTPQQQSQAIVEQNRKKVIPTVQANANSPLPQKPKTLADLKKYAANLT